MTRENLKKKIDEIIIEELDLNKNFFKDKTDIIMSDIIKEPLMAYQVLAQIESKLDILIDDTPMHTKELSYEDFIDIFYNEYLREKGE